jgi:hypothetical protein
MAGHGHGVVAEYGFALVISLLQPHATAAAEIDGGPNLHRGLDIASARRLRKGSNMPDVASVCKAIGTPSVAVAASHAAATASGGTRLLPRRDPISRRA